MIPVSVRSGNFILYKEWIALSSFSIMTTISSIAKKLGFWSATAVIIGSIIGSGVFMKPATMAGQLGSPVWMTIVWIIAGVFSLFGALVYAELGAMKIGRAHV